jgi:hypothetical protein
VKTSLVACAIVLGIALALQATCAGARADGFDHDFEVDDNSRLASRGSAHGAA